MSKNVKHVSKTKAWFYELRMLHGFLATSPNLDATATSAAMAHRHLAVCLGRPQRACVSPRCVVHLQENGSSNLRKEGFYLNILMFQECVEHVFTFSRWFIPIYPNTVPDWWTKWTIKICWYPASCLDEPQALKTMAGHMLVFHGPTE